VIVNFWDQLREGQAPAVLADVRRRDGALLRFDRDGLVAIDR
jgi:hypothetical protein